MENLAHIAEDEKKLTKEKDKRKETLIIEIMKKSRKVKEQLPVKRQRLPKGLKNNNDLFAVYIECWLINVLPSSTNLRHLNLDSLILKSPCPCLQLQVPPKCCDSHS